MDPFAELVKNYFFEEDKQQSWISEDENPLALLIRNYFSDWYQDCNRNNRDATKLSNSFVRDHHFGGFDDDDESKDEYNGGGSPCVDGGCPLCEPDHVCRPYTIDSSLTDSPIRLAFSVLSENSPDQRNPTKFDVFFFAQKVIQMIDYAFLIDTSPSTFSPIFRLKYHTYH